MTRVFNRPLVGWSVCGLLLAGLGWVLHDRLPPPPRWTVDGVTRWPTFSADSARVLTMSWTNERYQGPIHVRDLATGATVFQWGDKVDGVLAHGASADFRRWAGVVTREGDPAPILLVMNLEIGEERVLPFALERGWIVASQGLKIAPHGELAAVMISPIVDGRAPIFQGRIHMIETDTGRVVARLPWKGPLVEFTPDGAHLVYEHHEGRAHVVGVWDTRARQVVASALLPGIDRPWMTGDGKALYLTDRAVDTDGPPRTILFDLPSGRRRELFDANVAHLSRVSPDGRLLAVVPRLRPRAKAGEEVIVFDVAGGARIGAVPAQAKADVVFSDDGQRLFIIDEAAGSPRYRMVHTATCAVLWELSSRDYPLAHFLFTPDRSTLVVCNWSAARVILLSADTGEQRGTVRLGRVPEGKRLPGGGPLTQIHGRFLNASSLEHGGDGTKSFITRFLEDWLGLSNAPETPPHRLTIVDTHTGRIAFHSYDDVFRDAWLSPDGQSILASGDLGAMRCYDVPARRPWLDILGIPLALAIVLLALRAGLRRWRRRVIASLGAPP